MLTSGKTALEYLSIEEGVTAKPTFFFSSGTLCLSFLPISKSQSHSGPNEANLGSANGG